MEAAPNGLDGQDGRAQNAPHSVLSKLSTASMASICSELAAKAAVVLIGVACSLRERQVAAQVQDFLDEGGFTERLYRVRSAQRRQLPDARQQARRAIPVK